MGQTIILTRTDTFMAEEGEDNVRKEKITCPQGVQINGGEIRDRQSGHVLAWQDSKRQWHSTGTGAIYTSMNVSESED